jgi:hypothetical protein
VFEICDEDRSGTDLLHVIGNLLEDVVPHLRFGFINQGLVPEGSEIDLPSFVDSSITAVG